MPLFVSSPQEDVADPAETAVVQLLFVCVICHAFPQVFEKRCRIDHILQIVTAVSHGTGQNVFRIAFDGRQFVGFPVNDIEFAAVLKKEVDGTVEKAVVKDGTAIFDGRAVDVELFRKTASGKIKQFSGVELGTEFIQKFKFTLLK